jgi:Uma2 family endonuclease
MSTAELPRTEGAVRAGGDESLFEVINGQVVELPPISFHANKIASCLIGLMWSFAMRNGLGVVVGETLFRLPLAKDRYRNRRPDVAFVSYQRWPRDKPESGRDNAWDVVPDLAVEVVSPNDLAEDLMDKVAEYFEAGVRQVWVVYPGQRLVRVYDSLEAIRVVAGTDALDGGSVLPGLRIPLTDLFVFATLDERGAEGQSDK